MNDLLHWNYYLKVNQKKRKLTVLRNGRQEQTLDMNLENGKAHEFKGLFYLYLGTSAPKTGCIFYNSEPS